ncbi:MAG: peptidase domain-containing ABC transporter [Sulfuricella sp.]|nr:peptidase domain-containing ABC transporter [Sulfuricella sp.]
MVASEVGNNGLFGILARWGKSRAQPGWDLLPLAREEWLWALDSLCQLQRIPSNPALLLQQNPPPHTLGSLRKAAFKLGLKNALHPLSSAKLADMHFPCLALLKAEGENTPSRAAILARYDGGKLLYFVSGEQTPRTLDAAELSSYFEPVALLVTPEREALADDSVAPAAPPFGFKWFVPELLKHKALWKEVLLASLAIQLVGLATPLFTQVIIDKVVVHHTTSTLAVIAVALFAFMLFTAAMSWVRQYLVLHTGNRIDAVLGSRVFERLMELPLRYYQHRSTGTLVARLHGVETIREFITGAAVALLLDLPFLVIFLAIMLYYSWPLTLIVLAMLALVAVLSFFVTPLLRDRINRQFLLGARNQAFLTEYVSGMETVKSLQMEPQLKQRYGGFLADYLAAGFDTRQLANGYNTAANTLDQLQTLAVLCVGAWIVMHDANFTVGMLVAFQMFAGRLSGPVLRIVGLWQEFQQAAIAVKRLGDIMGAPGEPYSVIPVRAAGGNGRIDIEGLSFRYGEDRPYLYRNLNLTVQPGRCVVLAGPSGCGKSTLAKLLQGFYQPNDGRILIDGRDIRHLSANELRAHFGVVPQETQLFSGTIYDNLLLANPHAAFEQVMEACRLAEIHDVIEKLPQGYQSEIGEHGAGLSGGQKQRIAIARALLKRPKILIFDEAVSNLDAPTAEHFAATVNRLKGKVTVLFITHQIPKGLLVDEAVGLGETLPPAP